MKPTKPIPDHGNEGAFDPSSLAIEIFHCTHTGPCQVPSIASATNGTNGESPNISACSSGLAASITRDGSKEKHGPGSLALAHTDSCTSSVNSSKDCMVA